MLLKSVDLILKVLIFLLKACDEFLYGCNLFFELLLGSGVGSFELFLKLFGFGFKVIDKFLQGFIRIFQLAEAGVDVLNR